jgi:hypothetical protein
MIGEADQKEPNVNKEVRGSDFLITAASKHTSKEEITMTKNEQMSTMTRPQPIPAPDGKSELPTELPDYDPPTSTPSGDSGTKR